MNHYGVPDTRAFPETDVKNELAAYAGALVSGSGANAALARGQLDAAVRGMLAQRHYLPLSVALAMARSSAHYRVLWAALNRVLTDVPANGWQWLAFPVVFVCGAERELVLPVHTPSQALIEAAGGEWTKVLAQAVWLPELISPQSLCAVRADAWYAAAQSENGAIELAQQLSADHLALPTGQNVRAAFAVCRIPAECRLPENPPAEPLRLMQSWQAAWQVQGAVLFANPLSPVHPYAAPAAAESVRQTMMSDVFVSNALRAVRLQTPRAAAVIAADVSGSLLVGIGASDDNEGLQPHVFHRPVAPEEDWNGVIHHFVELFAECRVEHVRLLHDVVDNEQSLPTYAASYRWAGHNPYFSDVAQEIIES